jgi:hypothetical protein
MRIAIAAVVVLAACDSDTLRIAFQISAGPVQACPSAAVPAAPTCGDVPMLCDAVLDIRIRRPADPPEKYTGLCEAVPRGGKPDLCAIEQINLPVRQLPKDTLEVQVMIWPRDAVKADPISGELDCREIYGQRVSIGFGVHGFPEEVVPSPALGGRAYYQPGDSQTVVTLGCSDLAVVNRPSCSGRIEIQAGVNQFDAPLAPVMSPAGLLVSIGEPHYTANRDEHEWSSIRSLDLLAAPEPPTWVGALDTLDIEDSLCVEVIGTSGANTAVLRCARIDAGARKIDLLGTFVPMRRLVEIVESLSLSEIPPQGLTIGVLLDEQGRPAAGYSVRTSPDTMVQYLNLSGQVDPGLVTTANGLFVSQDAPYGADFRAYQGLTERTGKPGVGGRVNGKVTVVVLQLGS